MSGTYTALHYHLVFSTKERQAWIPKDIEKKVWRYIAGITRKNRMTPLEIGGMADHVHILLGVPPSLPFSKAVQFIKGGSSKWIHETFQELRHFGWQEGYGAFTVSKSNVPDEPRTSDSRPTIIRIEPSKMNSLDFYA